MWPEAPPSTAGHHPAEIELHVFPGQGESILHEDDGLTFDGGFYRTTFTLDGRTLRAAATGDGYPEFARERFVVVCEGTRRTVEDREFEVTL
jgi:alpha-glucosidase